MTQAQTAKELPVRLEGIKKSAATPTLMSAMLKKHRATAEGEDTELEDSLIDEMDNIDAEAESRQPATDPRWDALRKLSTPGDEE